MVQQQLLDKKIQGRFMDELKSPTSPLCLF